MQQPRLTPPGVRKVVPTPVGPGQACKTIKRCVLSVRIEATVRAGPICRGNLCGRDTRLTFEDAGAARFPGATLKPSVSCVRGSTDNVATRPLGSPTPAGALQPLQIAETLNRIVTVALSRRWW